MITDRAPPWQSGKPALSVVVQDLRRCAGIVRVIERWERRVNREINLSGPDLTEAEIEAVVAVLRTPRLSLGPKLAEFEQMFTERIAVEHAIACNSGTSALHLCWCALGLAAGDEVITTPFSFIASSNSVMFCGGRPVFVDVDPLTWQLDATRIEAAITPRTRAILPVDIFGSLPDMDAILEIARRHDLRVLEDSCEALGASYKGRLAGTFGEAGAFGFYPNKQITTGEGGMIVTDDDEIACVARSMRNQGRDPEAGWLAHARLGYNYRLSDVNCAIGVEQMRRLDEILAKRTRVAQWYRERLAEERRVAMQSIPAEVAISWFVMVVRLSDDYKPADRDDLLGKLTERGIGCSNYFSPIHLQPFYQECLGYREGDYPVTEALAARTIALPFHNGLSEADVEHVVTVLRELL
ncbi:MAG: DegT/DnrJ/EryC1/StrS family aminotransferase [Planctomycetes bacterium]|nr:DegT/DnrJ/EryC1/StrS family aminotransferase [Planctomycetota bacterium]